MRRLGNFFFCSYLSDSCPTRPASKPTCPKKSKSWSKQPQSHPPKLTQQNHPPTKIELKNKNTFGFSNNKRHKQQLFCWGPKRPSQLLPAICFAKAPSEAGVAGAAGGYIGPAGAGGAAHRFTASGLEKSQLWRCEIWKKQNQTLTVDICVIYKFEHTL